MPLPPNPPKPPCLLRQGTHPRPQALHQLRTHLKESESGAMGVRMVQGTLGATTGPPADME